MAAFSGFYDSHEPPPLGDASSAVPAMKVASKGGILHCCFVDCRPGGHRGDTEWAVTWWQRPVASGVALDMLNWVMHFVSHRRTPMLIEMADGQGALFPIIDFVIDHNCS